MNIGLIDVDSHNFPNLPLMKLSAHHKARGDSVEFVNPLFGRYDRVYMSKVFTFTPDYQYAIQAGDIVRSGTGYHYPDGGEKLPVEVDHVMPDYRLYGISDTAYGFLTRGCPRGCGFCIVAQKEGRKSVHVSDVKEFVPIGTKQIKLLDPNILACADHNALLAQLAQTRAWIDFTQGLDARLLTEENIRSLNSCKVKMLHFAWDDMKQSAEVLRGLELYARAGSIADRRKRCVYVLTNYDTTHEEDIYRLMKLREMDFDPYVMIYEKQTAPRKTRLLQRWANNKIIWRSCDRFEDYDERIG